MHICNLCLRSLLRHPAGFLQWSIPTVMVSWPESSRSASPCPVRGEGRGKWGQTHPEVHGKGKEGNLGMGDCLDIRENKHLARRVAKSRDRGCNISILGEGRRQREPGPAVLASRESSHQWSCPRWEILRGFIWFGFYSGS